VNKTILNRLTALEAARRPVEQKPVDMRPVLARMNMVLIALHHGGKRPSESYLAGFARRAIARRLPPSVEISGYSQGIAQLAQVQRR
jgi:hypothetical protein